jgi:hypothetical protein
MKTHAFHDVRDLGEGRLLRHMLLHRNECRFIDLGLV